MEEQEARANRFASLQAGGTGNVKLPYSNSNLHLLRVARLRVLHLRGLLDRAEVQLDHLQDEYSDQRNGQTSQTRLDFS
jgi:hypothetical protein